MPRVGGTDLHATMYGDTALAPDGAEHFGGFDGTSLTGLQLHPYSGVLIQGQRHTLFSVLVSDLYPPTRGTFVSGSMAT